MKSSSMQEKSMSKYSLSLLLIFLLSLFFIGEARAAVPNSCSITGVGDVNFGSYDVLSALNNDSTGSITVDCGPDAWTYNVRISIGPSPNSGGFTPRKMKLATGTDLLNYNLFTTASRDIIWGDGTSGTSTITRNIQKNRPWTGTVYGRMPPGQDVGIGSYGEVLVITINF